ncbi:MAG: prolyl oligopeptidase family serine peptidase [Cyclobacteriaceae bacterium]|nr:prolyl oligopeptidase family serine peptidase [Cyclobacteriaceae bacterium]
MNRLVSVLFICIAFSCSKSGQEKITYPVTRKVDSADTYFGTTVPDPYRWLENDTARETAEWVARQNEVTFAYLNKIPFRDAIRKRLDELQNYERIGAPEKNGDYYYYYRNTGLQNHNVWYRKKINGGEEEVFIDPNTFSADGTTSLAGMFFSNDGSLVTLLIQEGGSDWRKAVTLRTSDKSVVGDTLKDLKFTGIAWKGNDGFYYSRYDNPKGNRLFSKVDYNRVYYHKLNTPQSADKVVYDGGAQNPQRRAGAALTEDERFLIISTSITTSGNELYIQDLTNQRAVLTPLVTDFKNDHDVIDNDGTRLIIRTNLNAPNGKIVVTDAAQPSPENWKDLIPETSEPIRSVSTAGKRIFVAYLKDAKSLIKQYDYTGKLEREVELPAIGTAGGFKGRRTDTEVYYTFTSFTYPPTIFKYDIATGKSTEYARPNVSFNPDDYTTEQIFYTSKDGTRVPMFIVYRKGVERNGKNATWLYGYGGFNISLTPSFATSRIVWLENGGIFAQPNLRGGGEYGKQWHLAGTKMNKQNVFDDFIAAAEYLIKEKFTSPDYLAIAGGSNGGLLVGATMTQRPDLMKVALPAVGVLDMLRYHKFTVGAAWAYDYGTADESKEMFEYLRKYSPLHALKPGTAYPATLITTADHDDRVIPAHSFKFAATLQEYQSGNNPVLIRIDVKSGHGSSNLSKALDVTADQFAFAWYNMGVTPPLLKKE